MAEEQIDLASKDVFILLEVPIPENLETSTNWQELTENKDEENESQLTLDEDDKLHFHVSKIDEKVTVCNYLILKKM